MNMIIYIYIHVGYGFYMAWPSDLQGGSLHRHAVAHRGGSHAGAVAVDDDADAHPAAAQQHGAARGERRAGAGRQRRARGPARDTRARPGGWRDVPHFLMTGWSIGVPVILTWEPILNWLVVWNMTLMFPYIGNVIIPTDELIFFRGVETTNQPTFWWCWMMFMDFFGKGMIPAFLVFFLALLFGDDILLSWSCGAFCAENDGL